MGIQSTKEKLASTGQTFRFGPEVILQLATAATLMVMAAVAIFVVKGSVNSVLLVNLESGLILMAAVNSVAIAAGAVVIALPVGLVSALYITELAPSQSAKTFWTAIKMLSAVPSVVIGFIGLVWLGYTGSSQVTSPLRTSVAASLLLALMVYPPLTSFLIEHLRRIPASLRASSYALGASRWQTIAYTVYPAARSIIAAAGFFGLSRAMGDTAIVLMLWQAAVRSSLVGSQGSRLFTIPTAIIMGAERGWHHSGSFLMALLIVILSLGFSALGRRFMQSHWRGQE
jgi:phosphate transport system permease protein